MYEKQMELFEDGGLRQEGGMVDEESGNEVPVGSTRKEVRDDIPAMLSEGEFVFPADVVRYIGLENLMRMRQDAKQGLKRMDAMGQMGNGDEATMPDDLPFGMMDLIIIDGEEEEPEVEKKAQGGVVHMNEGGFTTNSFRVPKFDPRNQDVRQFENSEGKKLNIPFLDGKPVYPIPEGYFPVGTVEEEEKDETKEAIPTDDDDSPTPPPQSEFQKAGGWDMDFGDPPDPKKVDLWIKEAEKVSTVGNLVTGVAAAVNPVLAAVVHFGNKANKKGIADNYERAVAAASKTPTKGQLDRLKTVDKRLTTKEGKGILSTVVNGLIDQFGGVFNSEEEKNAAKVQSGVAVGTGSNLSDEEIEKRIKIGQTGLEKMADAKAAEKLSNLLASEDEAKIAGSKLKEDGTYDISSWFTDAPAPETPEAIPTEPKTPEVQLEVGPAAPVAPETPEAIPTAPELPVDITPSNLRKTPEGISVPTDSTFKPPEEGETPSSLPLRTAQTQLGANALLIENAMEELRKSMPYRGPVSGMTMKEKLEDPAAPFRIGYEKLSNAISQAIGGDDTPTPTPTTTPTPTPTSSGGDDDDGPSFASVGDNATAAQQASQNVTTTVEKDESGNVTGVTTTGGTEEEQQTMQDYVTSAAAGAKGGLFTRRKKKKK